MYACYIVSEILSCIHMYMYSGTLGIEH